MRGLRTFAFRMLGQFQRRSADRDISAELESHLDLHIADNMRAGMSELEARRQALVALGGVAQTRDRVRDRSRVQWLDELAQDLKFAARVLLKDRGFTMAVVAVLALGIGANAAIFAVVDALVLRPLPFAEPDRLAIIWEDASEIGFPKNTPASGNYFSWKERNRTFSAMAATRSATANLTAGGPPEFVMGRRVTANFFDVLGVRPLLGRTFTEDEDRTAALVTIISYGLWQRRYSGDPNVIGQTIVMNGQRRTIVGVMPRGFVFRDREREFWSPIAFTPDEQTQRNSHFLNVVGRLAPGIGIDAAQKDMARVAAELERELPRSNARQGTLVEPLRDDLLANRREQLDILMAASLCVLVIACANVAGLLLLRALNRRGELAVRASLGATSGRLVRQLVAEGILLALAGATAGLVLAPAGIRVLADMVPQGMFPIDTSVLDVRVVAVTLTIALLTAVIFSLGPAWHAARLPLVEGLQQAGRSRMAGSRATREVLVVAQIAVALMLLVGTGLLLRTFVNLRGSELGFNPEHVLTLRTTLPLTKYQQHADRVTFFDRVVTQVKALPGVQGAAYVSTVPFGTMGNTWGFLIEGRSGEDRQDALVRIGTVDYLKTIGAELVGGRFLDDRDQEHAPGVIVISETFARLYWPGRSAVGRRVSLGGPDQMRTIVGVVRDVRERGYELEAKPAAYLANTQVAGTFFLPEILVVRASGDLTALVTPLRRAIATVDPEQPISAIRTMDELLDSTIVDRRQQMTLLAVFASIAVVLAALGLYAVLAYAVAQRRREIAVRMAVGATGGSVVRAVAWGGQRLVLAGLAIGLGGAWAASRMMAALLRGVTASDPLTYGSAGALLWAVAVVACAIPAVRAARISPASLLRD